MASVFVFPASSNRRRFLALAAACAAAPARAAHEVTPWPAGKAVPAFALQGLDGQAWDLRRLRGRVVVLNFWATWCEPCRAEMPSLDRLAQRHADGRLVVLAVNYQEHEARVRRFLESMPLQMPVVMDRDGQAARAWTRRIFPSTVLIDAAGRPRLTVTGEYDWDGPDAQRLIEPLLRTVSR